MWGQGSMVLSRLEATSPSHTLANMQHWHQMASASVRLELTLLSAASPRQLVLLQVKGNNSLRA